MRPTLPDKETPERIRNALNRALNDLRSAQRAAKPETLPRTWLLGESFISGPPTLAILELRVELLREREERYFNLGMDLV